ncbi:MAG TPA: carboxypeptidase-like regulatory domain-containing protein, partial [Vicinamibacterales bacterium]
MKRALVNAAVILTILLSPMLAWAQATGQINGVVTDPSGAVLPGVTIEATSDATGATRSAVT